MSINTEERRRPVAVVTGGKQGLGSAAALELAREGFDLAIADIQDPDAGLTESLSALAEAGARAEYYQLDIAATESHAGFISAVLRDFGSIDCLLDNAGIAARPLTDIMDLSEEAFDRSVAVNLRGTFFLTQRIARHMIETPAEGTYRSIIVVSSIAADFVNVERAQYHMTKAGLSMMSRLFALRLAQHDIAVHEVRPGFIQTAMTASAGGTAVDDWIGEGRVPIARWGRPEDVGRTVATLASGRLPYSTGQAHWVAGGLQIQQAP